MPRYPSAPVIKVCIARISPSQSIEVRPDALVRAVLVKESKDPTLDAKGNTPGKCVFSVTPNLKRFAEVVPVKIDRTYCEPGPEDHLPFHRIQTLGKVLRVS